MAETGDNNINVIIFLNFLEIDEKKITGINKVSL
jgi:hypothetical protein